MKFFATLCALSLTLPLMLSGAANAEQLGRLFFTPAQRAQMDDNYARAATSDNSRPGLILNGIVQRDGGNRTTWVNGIPQQAGSSDAKTPESAPVTLPGQNKTVKLKVGQRVLLSPAAKPDQAGAEATQPDRSKPDEPKQETAQP